MSIGKVLPIREFQKKQTQKEKKEKKAKMHHYCRNYYSTYDIIYNYFLKTFFSRIKK